MCATKKAEFFEYEYKRNVGKSCGVSRWVFFYLHKVLTVLLMPCLLYETYYEIEMFVLLSIYTAFIFILCFVPVRAYEYCTVFNIVWLIITVICFGNLRTESVVNENVMVNMYILGFEIPLVILHSAILSVVLISIKRYTEKKGTEYRVMNGEDDSETKKWTP